MHHPAHYRLVVGRPAVVWDCASGYGGTVVGADRVHLKRRIGRARPRRGAKARGERGARDRSTRGRQHWRGARDVQGPNPRQGEAACVHPRLLASY
jgi:hypothetical protein